MSRILKNFINGDFKRHIILRDIGNAYALLTLGFNKEALIIAGGVIEEILRLFLENKNYITKSKTFYDYLKICENEGVLRNGISKLTDFVREFRNLVHISREKNKSDTINKAHAKNAIASIFSIINDIKTDK